MSKNAPINFACIKRFLGHKRINLQSSFASQSSQSDINCISEFYQRCYCIPLSVCRSFSPSAWCLSVCLSEAFFSSLCSRKLEYSEGYIIYISIFYLFIYIHIYLYIYLFYIALYICISIYEFIYPHIYPSHKYISIYLSPSVLFLNIHSHSAIYLSLYIYKKLIVVGQICRQPSFQVEYDLSR